MLSYLKSHPFAVEAFFESSLVLTFAVPKEQLQHLIPECLKLDTFNDKWAFIAIAMVQTKSLRPKGFPEFLGNDFFSNWLQGLCSFQEQGRQELAGVVYPEIRDQQKENGSSREHLHAL